MPADELNELVGGELIRTHRKGDCIGEHCTIHNRSNHHMAEWKQVWDRSARMMRICPHNVAHVDPDELPRTSREHSCDGCCIPGYEPNPEFQADVSDLMTVYESENSSPIGGVHLHAGMDPLAEIEKLLKSLRTTTHKGVDIETD